ncbi:hypothetical protein HanPI659440_Chr02g0042631 [Helianthus annuus]|nr:hypothetical protein HanPI659440_Chr02g0042631 [Helianthus annuus]
MRCDDLGIQYCFFFFLLFSIDNTILTTGLLPSLSFIKNPNPQIPVSPKIQYNKPFIRCDITRSK